MKGQRGKQMREAGRSQGEGAGRGVSGRNKRRHQHRWDQSFSAYRGGRQSTSEAPIKASSVQLGD